MSTQAKISVQTAAEILERAEIVKSLVIGLLAAIEEEMAETDEAGSGKVMTAAKWFIVDKQILLSTFGDRISEGFSDLVDYVKKQETFRDLN